MKISLHLIFVALIVLISASCKKYDEGPMLSMRSKKSRIVNEWRLDQVLFNGSVVPSYINTSWDIKRDQSIIITSGTTTSKMEWDLSSDKEKLIISKATSSSTDTYEILRLKAKELWLKESNYEYRFIKK